METLRALVARSGKSQAYVAREAGISASALSAILRGKRKPQPKTIYALSRALGVDPSALIEHDVEQDVLEKAETTGRVLSGVLALVARLEREIERLQAERDRLAAEVEKYRKSG